MRVFLAAILILGVVAAVPAADGPLKSEPIAMLFGSHPDIRGMRLSPDGSKISFLKTHPDGYTIALVLDLVNPKSTVIMASLKDKNNIAWCRWANNERILCAFQMQSNYQGNYYTVTRMMAVNADGTEGKDLLEDQLGDQRDFNFSQIQTNIIDMLPDDPDHVLIQTFRMGGTGVGIMDVHTGRYTTKERERNGVSRWVADGHGNPRIYNRSQRTKGTWHINEPGKLLNREIRTVEYANWKDIFSPEGFGENLDELLYFGVQEGRTSLFAMDLIGEDLGSRLVYTHPRVDIASTYRLGKYDRLVAAVYYEDTLHYSYFDKDIRQIYDLIKVNFLNDTVVIIDEDWNRRYYLVAVTGDTNPGTYYRFDKQENKLARIGPLYSSMKDTVLSKMSALNYPARDGVEIPAYLSLPASGAKTNLPAVILPHGGPSSRDVWGFDFLVQYLTARGYAVLQSNYRGSYGYGQDWLGDGAFQNWRTAINDITDGARYLVDQGIADVDRICVVGWSYGGYAALMSGIEEPDLYRCIVSIAGVTDPKRLGWTGGFTARTFIGTTEDVTEEGSPIVRVAEFQDPVFLAHAEKDLNVRFNQSELMYDALKEHGKSAEFITYEHAEHSIVPERYRIDLLTRVGEFLEQNTR